MALKFGVCMCYLSNKKLAKFARKRTKYEFFPDLLGTRQHSQKSSGKNNPSSLIVLILQFTKNLRMKFFIKYNDIGNLKILWLILKSKEVFKILK